MVTYFADCRHKVSSIPGINDISHNSRAIFLDRDGTIIAEKIYLRDVAGLEFLPGAIADLKILAATGLPLYIFTNQAGIAHGYFTEETLNQIHIYLVGRLREAGIKIRGIYYCPHHPYAEIEAYRYDCDCRKPKPGLLKMAARAEQLNLAESYVIGDKLSDLNAGKQVAAKTALVLTGYGLEEFEKITKETAPDFIGHNLEEIALWVSDDLGLKGDYL
jgi:D-glycero-D-manno-heptose 1,7-bisphosphate phosphatase